MKKMPVLSFFAAVLYSSAVFARICFLADTACQSGKFNVDAGAMCLEQDPTLLPESKLCEGLNYGSAACNDITGNYFHEGTCPGGYTDMENIDDDKYECRGSRLCGRCCRQEDLKCVSRYSLCTENADGIAEDENDSCEDSEGVKYLKCTCNSSTYGVLCAGDGLEGDPSNTCIDSDGRIWYKSCTCASGWSQVAKSSINCPSACADSCRLGEAVLLPDSGEYCWTGAECLEQDAESEQCLISYQSNFDGFWGGYDVNETCRNLNVDCDSLGYVTGIAGKGVKCVDGSDPFRCPFDHTRVYCESGIAESCAFTSKSECEVSYFGSVCSLSADGCYKPSACKSGYGKSVSECSNGQDGIWSLSSVDSFGCGTCQCENTCVDTISVVPLNALPVTQDCSACGTTKKITTAFICNPSYTLSANGKSCVLKCSKGTYETREACVSAGNLLCFTDRTSGCWSPASSTGGCSFEYSLTTCPEHGNCTPCSSNSSKLKLDSCDAGYAVNGNSCYDCAGNQTKIKNVTSKTYYQQCLSSSCSNSCTSTSGGNVQWDNKNCICSLIGVSYCLPPADDKELADPSSGSSSSVCSDADKARCETAKTQLTAFIDTHNKLCPSNTVSGSASFDCGGYIDTKHLAIRCMVK